jgi:hypothetical protein
VVSFTSLPLYLEEITSTPLYKKLIGPITGLDSVQKKNPGRNSNATVTEPNYKL